MKRIVKLLSLLLTLCILLGSLSSCMTAISLINAKIAWNKGEFAPKEDSLWKEYTLSDQHEVELNAAIEEIRIKVQDGGGIVEINQAMLEMQELFYFINDQANVAYILYSMNMKDEKAKSDYLYASGMAGRAYDGYMKLCRDIYQSDYPIKDQFFMAWGDTEKKQLSGWNDEYSRLQENHDRFVVEFNELDPAASDFDSKVAQLYIRVRDNNNQMAKGFGYESYADYAYEMVYFRDYTPADVERIYQYANTYLVPAFKSALNRFNTLRDELTEWQFNQLVDLISADDADWEQIWLAGYFDSLPASIQFYMEDMINSGRAVYTDADSGVLEGAFTVYLYQTGYPVCYFGKGYQDMFTVVHEAGHYYSMSVQQGTGTNIDLAEVYSQVNEILLLSYLGKTDIDPKVYEALVAYRQYQQMSVIFMALIVDEFERKVHEDDTLTGLADAYRLDQIMDSVEARYGTQFVQENIGDMNNYWRYVTIPQPMYYISYAVSGIAAMQFYINGLDNYDEAVKTYKNLVCDISDVNAFKKSLVQVGLTTPFHETTYQNIQQFLEER